jgi:protocatechuate 3,4-dioxygenase, beta subunit
MQADASSDSFGTAHFRLTNPVLRCPTIMNNTAKAAISILAVALVLVASAVPQVDQDWLEKWNEAQTHRPQVIPTSSRIATANEPGTPLVIRGRIVHPEGTTPEGGAVVFAYHTDNTGVYYATGSNLRAYRLTGWARTDADGRFEFTTIRPAPYPGRRVPAHVHFTVETSHYGRQWFGLLFADDPLVSEKEKADSERGGKFGDVLRVERTNQGEVVSLNVRLKAKGDF